MSDGRIPFGLTSDQVPEPPSDAHYRDILRWLIVVMDDDDEHLPFVASMLGQCIDRPGLTKRQAKWADKILTRVNGWYEQGVLDCQRPIGDVSENTGSGRPALRVVEPEVVD